MLAASPFAPAFLIIFPFVLASFVIITASRLTSLVVTFGALDV